MHVKEVKKIILEDLKNLDIDLLTVNDVYSFIYKYKNLSQEELTVKINYITNIGLDPYLATIYPETKLQKELNDRFFLDFDIEVDSISNFKISQVDLLRSSMTLMKIFDSKKITELCANFLLHHIDINSISHFFLITLLNKISKLLQSNQYNLDYKYWINKGIHLVDYIRKKVPFNFYNSKAKNPNRKLKYIDDSNNLAIFNPYCYVKFIIIESTINLWNNENVILTKKYTTNSKEKLNIISDLLNFNWKIYSLINPSIPDIKIDYKNFLYNNNESVNTLIKQVSEIISIIYYISNMPDRLKYTDVTAFHLDMLTLEKAKEILFSTEYSLLNKENKMEIIKRLSPKLRNLDMFKKDIELLQIDSLVECLEEGGTEDDNTRKDKSTEES